MTIRWRATALLAVSAACARDEPLSFGAMAGDWSATSAFYVDGADGGRTYDLLSGVRSLGLGIHADGTVVIFVDGAPFDTTVATLDADVVHMNNGQRDDYRVALDGPTMVWTSLFAVPFDFDGDGLPEVAFERISWRRN